MIMAPDVASSPNCERLFVCLSVCLFVRQAEGSVKTGLFRFQSMLQSNSSKTDAAILK